MRIGINFHSADRYLSGVEYYSLGLINALLRIDTRNDYIVYTNRPDLVTEHVKSSDNLTLIKLKNLKTRTERILWEHIRLPQLAQRRRLDVLHCLGYICPIRKKSVPYVVTIHDTIAIDSPKWCKRTNALYFNLLMKSTVAGAYRVIAVSKCTAQDIRRNFNLPLSRVRIIYPGVDSIFKPNGAPWRLREVRVRYKLPQRYILYVGNIEPRKNISALLAVQSSIQAKALPHKLVIAGKRAWRAGAELAEIANRARSNNVIFIGYVDRSDLPFVYQMADVFVFPSLYEGFGFPPLEAMACGTAVISSCRGALAETINDAALVVEPHNIQQITQALLSIIKEESLREKYIRMGLKKSGQFNWESTARQTLSVYQEVLSAND